MPDLPAGVNPDGLTDQEALDILRQKIDMPTRRWSDLLREEHDHAFVVAGATQTALLEDIHTAVEKAIEDGESLEDFRERFDGTVARNGWDFRGGRDWRTRVIYETNMRSAHSSGRYKQMTDPAVLEDRPWWQYKHGGSREPRPQHLAWDGMVIDARAAWWRTHYPPGGWGCSCYVLSWSDDDLERFGLEPQDPPPVETYEWTDPRTGEVEDIPQGIDPGWDYTPGQSWVESQRSTASSTAPTRIPQGQAADPDTPAPPTPREAETVDTDASGDTPSVNQSTPPKLQDPERAAQYYRDLFVQETGVGDTGVIEDVTGRGLVVDGQMLDGMDEDLRPYTQLLGRTLRDPDEVWAQLAPRADDTERSALATRYITRWTIEGEELWVLVEEAAGQWHAKATIDPDTVEEIRARRQGVRLYRRGE